MKVGEFLKQHQLEQYAYEFELQDLEKDFERAIAEKVRDKFQQYTSLLEGFLNPEVLSAMHECTFFTEQELHSMAALHKELRKIVRSLDIAELQATPEAFMQTTNQALETWPGIKQQLHMIMQRLHDGWKQEQAKITDNGYLG